MPHYRPTTLTLIGLVWVAQAALITPGPRDPDLAILHEAIPPSVRVALWAATGLATIALAWSPRLWPWAGVIAVLMPAERVISHAWAYIMYLIPGVPGGDSQSLAMAIQWAAILGIVMVITRWPEHTRTVTRD